jgi:hypothetical protein
MARAENKGSRPRSPRGRERGLRRPTSAALAVASKLPPRGALFIIAIACATASIFAVTYSLALGRATPRHIPAALVGDSRTHSDLVAAVERAMHNTLSFTPYRSVAAAKQAVDEQRIYAALDLNGSHPRLLIASAAGVSVARLLTQAAETVERRGVPTLSVVDLHPLPPGDPQGLVSFYVTLAATLLGFITMFQMRSNVSPMGLRTWLGCIALLAVAGGLLLALITDPFLGALRGPFAELWALLAAETAVSALFASTMIVLVGRWAWLPTWLLFVAVGNSSSGGAVAPPLEPPFFAFIGAFLPTGATVEAIRGAVYFTHTQQLQPMVVESLWLVGGVAALLTSARLLGRVPGHS